MNVNNQIKQLMLEQCHMDVNIRGMYMIVTEAPMTCTTYFDLKSLKKHMYGSVILIQP